MHSSKPAHKCGSEKNFSSELSWIPKEFLSLEPDPYKLHLNCELGKDIEKFGEIKRILLSFTLSFILIYSCKLVHFSLSYINTQLSWLIILLSTDFNKREILFMQFSKFFGIKSW